MTPFWGRMTLFWGHDIVRIALVILTVLLLLPFYVVYWGLITGERLLTRYP